jgi:hypothetical protein
LPTGKAKKKLKLPLKAKQKNLPGRRNQPKKRLLKLLRLPKLKQR